MPGLGQVSSGAFGGAASGAAMGSMAGPIGTVAGGLIGAAGSVLGGLMSGNSQERLTQRNIDLQREFAENGISMRVADAKRAGLHPLAALGSFPTSFNPVVMEDPMGRAISQAGQDIGSSISRMQTSEERLSTRLGQELLRSQIGETDARRMEIEQRIMRNATEAQGPPSPLGIHPEGNGRTIEGQAPAIPGVGVPLVDVKAPQQFMTKQGDTSTMAGINAAGELVQFPGFKMWMPSGRGQESPQELWNEMPAYEKWGWIMNNVRRQGGNWLRDFVNFGLTGAEGKGLNQKPFMDNKLLSLGLQDALDRAMKPYFNEKQRYQRWKPNPNQPQRQRR